MDKWPSFLATGSKNYPWLIDIVWYSPELVDKRLTGIGYTKPCVLDLKMGTRMYGDFATETKRRSQVGRPFMGWNNGLCINSQSVLCRVSDPHWFNADPDTDPDPAFFSNCGSGFRIHPGFADLKLKKIYSWKLNFYFLHQKLPFTYP